MVEIAAEMAEESPKPRFSVTEVAQEDPAVFQEAAEEVNDKFENENEAKNTRFKKVRVMSGVSESEENSSAQNTYSNTKSYIRTFGRDTVEVTPREHYYRNPDTLRTRLARPTLEQLHEAQGISTHHKEDQHRALREVERKEETTEDPNRKKFGWIEGVLIRCLLNIWGVILFLRMSYIVGEAGVLGSIAIVALATVVTVLTTISMSAICTNGQVRGGGAYYLISRSLGPEFGGAIGLIFSAANAIAVALYVVGFAETVRDLLQLNGLEMVSFEHDVRIVGAITLILLLGITQAGMAWESKAQGVLLCILLVSILNYIIGVFIPKEFSELEADIRSQPTVNLTGRPLHLKSINSQGHFNMHTSVLKENLMPKFSEGSGFFEVFSIFFPAATGILAGSNISGDLKDPSSAIPKGTFSAIALTSTSYCILAVMLGAHSTRLAPGYFGQMDNNGSFLPDDFIQNFTEGDISYCENNPYSVEACGLGWNYTVIEKCPKKGIECRYGLKGDYATMAKISAYDHLITAGIFAATLSSALACLVSAPKVFQALGKDKLIPKIDWFAVNLGKDQEPRRAYFLTFIVSLAFILIGELNAIAPIISNFFLASYGLINYSCFSSSLANAPGFRPSFKYYNKWVALFAAFLCVIVMFISNWWSSLVTFVCIIIVYKYIDHRSLNVNWGSSGQAYTYTMAMKYTLKLASLDEHVKNYRPQILCLSGKPHMRPALVTMASQMTRNMSMCLFGDIQSKRNTMHDDRVKMQKYLDNNDVKGIYTPVQSQSLGEGALSLMSSAGVGKMKPNIVLLGFMHSWKTRIEDDIESYYNIIHDALTLNYGVGILNIPEGLDIIGPEQNGVQEKQTASDTIPINPSKKQIKTKLNCFGGTEEESIELNGIEERGSMFQGPPIERHIDVYWLFDDGGLTLLLPYLLSLRKFWSKAKIRVYTAGKEGQLDQDQINVSNLMSKFRIEFSEIKILPDVQTKPQQENINKFSALVKPFVRENDQKERDCDITEDDLENFQKKTYRQIRINELIKKHSSKADLIVVTLPIVRVNSCPAALYLAWLETITKDLPPTLLLRGNQESVLTFYS